MSTVLEVEEDTAQEELVDFCDVYLDNCLKTEAPLIFHRWAVLTSVGAALERKCYIKHGDDLVYPNMYTMLVGPSSSRKTTAISTISKMAKKAGFMRYFNGSTSKEKFLEDLANGFDNINKGDIDSLLDAGQTGGTSSVLVTAGEAVEFFGLNNGNLINLMTDLWDNHDEKVISSKGGGTVKIHNPTASLLAGTTTGQINNMWPVEIIGQGILSRTILVYCHGSGRKFTFPEPTNPEDLQAMTDSFRLITSKQGEFKLTEDARAAVDKIYHTWKPIRDGRFDSYTGRRLTHLLKLCLVYAAMDLAPNNNMIDVRHVTKANTTLTYAECYMPDALGEYGSALNSTLTNTIMTVVKAHRSGITQSQVMGAVHTEYAQQKEVLAAIVKLRDAGKIDVINKPGANDMMERFIYPITNVLRLDCPHVDYNLLAEYRYERK